MKPISIKRDIYNRRQAIINRKPNTQDQEFHPYPQPYHMYIPKYSWYRLDVGTFSPVTPSRSSETYRILDADTPSPPLQNLSCKKVQHPKLLATQTKKHLMVWMSPSPLALDPGLSAPMPSRRRVPDDGDLLRGLLDSGYAGPGVPSCRCWW